MSERTFYANIKSPTGGKHDLILYLFDIQTVGYLNHPLTGPEALVKYVQDHPECIAVSFTGTWMPQRPVPRTALNGPKLATLARRQWNPPVQGRRHGPGPGEPRFDMLRAGLTTSPGLQPGAGMVRSSTRRPITVTKSCICDYRPDGTGKRAGCPVCDPIPESDDLETY